MIGLIIAAVAALVGAGAATVVFWTTIKDVLSRWLRERNLQESALMSAVVILDRLAVGIRRQLRVHTHAYGVQIISEEQLSIDQIDDPEVRAQVERRPHVELDILRH